MTFSRYLIINKKVCCKYLMLICLPVDWIGGHSTPAGSRGHLRPHRRQGAEEAQGPPRGKRVTGEEINRTISRDAGTVAKFYLEMTK
jgi:hypothetical protein